MAKVGSIYVPADGDPNAKIMLVGESPGEDEESEGRGFVGRAGEILWRYLGDLGLQREQVWTTNLSHYRPSGNKFTNLLDTPQLKLGLEELKDDIKRIRPNVILALGNWALWYLTGKCGYKNNRPVAGSGITLWRGSVLGTKGIGRSTFVPYKVVAALHPAAILRQWTLHPTLKLDLSRAIKESGYPEIRYPRYASIINPERSIVDELAQSEYLTIDIELLENPKTKRYDKLACVGFADSPHRACCFTGDDEGWMAVQRLLQSPAKKILQYGHGLDIPWLWHYHGWRVNNYFWDTYIASATIHPEWPRTLNFLASIYTDHPYWKQDVKGHSARTNKDSLYLYNCTDNVVTFEVAMQQMEELKSWPVEVLL